MANGLFGGGDGTELSPFLVEDAQDLNAVRNNLTANYRQVVDIDLNEYENWVPIGFHRWGNPTWLFQGVFDGDNFRIRNLKSNQSIHHPFLDQELIDRDSIGTALFGGVGNCILKNIILQNVLLKGTSNISGLVGKIDVQSIAGNVTITNCHVTGTIEGERSVAGLIGNVNLWEEEASIVSIKKCSFEGNIKGINNGIGGLIGRGGSVRLSDSSLSIEECYVKNTTIINTLEDNWGGGNTGGLIGMLRDQRTTDLGQISLKNCKVTDTKLKLLDDPSLIDCEQYIGGLIGQVGRESTEVIFVVQNCLSSVEFHLHPNLDVNEIGNMAVLRYLSLPINFENCYYDKDVSIMPDNGLGVGRTTFQLTTAEANDNIDGEEVYTGWDTSLWSSFFPSSYPMLLDEKISIDFDAQRSVLGFGEGTEIDPYLINSYDGLRILEVVPSQYFKLINDIDLSDINFKPIGLNFADPLNWVPFTGGLDGDGFLLSNLTMNFPEIENLGMFMHLLGAKIRNLSLTTNIYGLSNIGALARKAENSDVYNINLMNHIVGQGSTDGLLSGLVVESINTSIDQVSIYGEILVENSYTTLRTGSLAGISSGSSYLNCYSHLSFRSIDQLQNTVDLYIGGLIGEDILTSSITNSYYSGSFQIQNNNLFSLGLIGSHANTIVNDSYYNSDLISIIDDQYGLPRNTVQLKSGYTNSTIEGQLLYANWDDNIWLYVSNESYPVLNQRTICNDLFDTTREVYSPFAGGTGTEENPFLVHNVEALRCVGLSNSHYEIINDIDCSELLDNTYENAMSDHTYNTVTVEGNNYTISNLVTMNSIFHRTGLQSKFRNIKFNNITFNCIENQGSGILFRTGPGSIENCHILNSFVTGSPLVFAAFTHGTWWSTQTTTRINNCSVELNYNLQCVQNTVISGFSAISTNTIVKNCHVKSTGIIESSDAVEFGGFVSSVNSSSTIISKCSTDTEVTIISNSSLTRRVGGFVSSVTHGATIQDSFSRSKIHFTNNSTSNMYTGGFAGYVNGGFLKRNHTVVDNESWNNQFSPTGGFVGAMATSSSIIEECLSSGSVYNRNYSGANYVGGFIGTAWAGEIKNCYAHTTAFGQSTSFNYVAGFMGRNQGSAIRNCYSTGYVSGIGGTLNLRGFSNRHSGSLFNCYHDRETSGRTDNLSSTGLARTTKQLKEGVSSSTIDGFTVYNTWDDTIWLFKGETYYPGLHWETFEYGILSDTKRRTLVIDISDSDTKRRTSIISYSDFDSTRTLYSNFYSFFDTKRTIQQHLLYFSSKEKYEPKLYLSSRSRKNIIPLPDAFNRQWILKLGKINELTFDYPYDSESVNDYTDIFAGKSFNSNNLIENLKEKYMIKLVYGDYVEWFEIQSNSDHSNEEFDYKKINCYSLAYELKTDDVIIDYSVVSYRLIEILKGKKSDNKLGLFENSLWQVGHIDKEVDQRFRSYDIANKNLLECIDDLCEIFNCVAIYDTENRIVSFRDINNVGKNSGLVFDYGKYLSTIEKENDATDICTRLKIYGNNAITIREINPLGTDYLEDYSHFMYPFEMDSLGNVVKSSNYDMSDDLCKAILTHQEKIKEYGGEFRNNLLKLRVFNQLLIAKSIELSGFQDKLKQLKDSLAVAKQGSGDSNLTITYSNEIEKTKEKIEIHSQQMQNINDKIQLINKSIEDIRFELSDRQNYTADELAEKKLFTFVNEYVENAITNVEDLFKTGQEYFETIKKPRTIININIVDFYDMIEAQEDWDRINIGTIVNVFYEKFNVRNESRIMEINMNYDDDSISLIIANMRDYENDYESLAKMIYKNNSFTKQMQTSKVRWDSIVQVRETLEKVLASPFEELKLEDSIVFERIYDEMEQIQVPELPDFDFGWIPGYIESLIPDIEIPNLPQVPEILEPSSGAGYLKGFIAPFDPISTMGVDFDLWFKYDDGSVVSGEEEE